MRKDTEQYDDEENYANPKKQNQSLEDQREEQEDEIEMYEEGAYSDELPSDGKEESDHPAEEGESKGRHHRLRDADPDTNKETDIPFGSKKKDEDRKSL